MQHVQSYYAQSLPRIKDYPELNEEIRVDVAIIGGGFTGVNTALELCERGIKVAIIEANKIGWGASGRNGGQVTGSLSGDEAMTKQLRKKMGSDAEKFVWALRWRGHDILKKRVEKYGIDCDLQHGHIQAAYKPHHMKALEQTYQDGVKAGMGDDLTLLSAKDIPNYLETDLYHGGLLNMKNMHIHSLKLCLGEAKAAESLGALIYENSPVIKIEHGHNPVIYTEKGVVRANSVVLAGNGYHELEQQKLSGYLFPVILGNMATARLPNSVIEAINPQRLAVYDTRFVLDYYRITADGRLMFGGGTNYSGRDLPNVANNLRPKLEQTFKRLKGVEIEYEWTCKAGIIITRIPLLGRLSKNVYYAQGYSGHGIATSHIVGEIMANALTNAPTEFEIFAAMRQIRLPFGTWMSQQLLALGMWYYMMRGKIE